MSSTLKLLLGIALAWLMAWSLAGFFMGRAGAEKLRAADHVAEPATRPARGAEVRVEGVVVGEASAVSPYRKQACLAAVTDVAVVRVFKDSNDRAARESHAIARRTVGPANLAIEVGEGRLELPIERWTPKHTTVEELNDLPPRLRVTPDELAAAPPPQTGASTLFSVSETTIDAGAHVFVVGRIEDREGSLRLEADPVLGHVVLYSGTQAELLRELRGSAEGLRVAAWILGAGVGPLPLLVLGAVLLARRRRGAAPQP